MNRMNTDIELLSAYIDGELDAPDAARLARRIATDETTARQAAKIAEVKSAVAALAQDVVVVTIPAKRWLRLSLIQTGLAACLGLAVIMAVWFTDVLGRDGEFEQATVQHDLWTEGSIDTGIAPASTPAGLFAPEMVAAGLTLALVRDDVIIGGTRVTQAGYVGRHGCRLSLFQVPGRSDAGQIFQLSSNGAIQRAAWSDASMKYLLVARGMDEGRFALIAGILRSASLGGGGRELETIASLTTMRQPCVG